MLELLGGLAASTGVAFAAGAAASAFLLSFRRGPGSTSGGDAVPPGCAIQAIGTCVPEHSVRQQYFLDVVRNL